MSGDVELLLTDLDITEAVVVGHSMGGKVAMSLALTQVIMERVYCSYTDTLDRRLYCVTDF